MTDVPSSFDFSLWQQVSNPYYLQYLEYNQAFLNLTNATEAPPVEEAAWVVPVKWVVCILLICLSACFSGLTLGLMGLDPYGLELIIKADPDAVEAKQAKTILIYRRDGNLMLSTLLLGNVAVNALLPIYLDELLGDLVAFFISTFALVIFGEITPQSVCSRYGLMIGSKLIWLHSFFTVILYPIAKPIALILDCILGDELGTIHNKNELVEIVKFHQAQGVMDEDASKTIKGALIYSDVPVEKVMTPMNQVFCLNEDDKLNFEIISSIFRTGHSRVPVLSREDKEVVVGILLVKDLILVDPDDAMPVSEVLNFFRRPVLKVIPKNTLGDVMAMFKTGKTHLGIVTSNESDIVERRKNSFSSSNSSGSGSSSDSSSDTDNENDQHQYQQVSSSSPKASEDQQQDVKEGVKNETPKANSKDDKHKIKKHMSIADKTVLAQKKKKRKKREKQRKKRLKEKKKRETLEAKSPGKSPGGSPKTKSGKKLHTVGIAAPGPDVELGKVDGTKNSNTTVASPNSLLFDDGKTHVVGVITLEDIIEEILGEEIVDETDLLIDMQDNRSSVKRDLKLAERISLLDSSETHTLRDSEVEIISQNLVEHLVRSITVRSALFKGRSLELSQAFLQAAMEVVQSCQLMTLTNDHLLARRNEPLDCAYMVLEGLINCFTGSSKFKSIAGRFQMVGAGVLEDCLLSPLSQVPYVTDYDAKVSSKKCRVLVITRETFADAFRSTVIN